MPKLPSGQGLMLSMEAIYSPQESLFPCPAGYFWYEIPTGKYQPPFEPNQKIEWGMLRAPVPKNQNQAKMYVKVLLGTGNDDFYWRGDWLSDFKKPDFFTDEDWDFWQSWLNSKDVREFLERVTDKCQKQSDYIQQNIKADDADTGTIYSKIEDDDQYLDEYTSYQQEPEGHGDKWGAISGDAEKFLSENLEHFVNKADCCAGSKEDRAVVFTYPQDSDLKYLFISRVESEEKRLVLTSIFPYCHQKSQPFEVVIDKFEDWLSPLEGHVSCSSKRSGMSLNFFDPFYCINKPIYENADSYTSIEIAGFALTLRKAEEYDIKVDSMCSVAIERQRVLEEDPEADVSSIDSVNIEVPKDAVFLLPGNYKGYCELRTQVLGVDWFSIDEIDYCKIKVTIIKNEEEAIVSYLYAPKRILGDYIPVAGDAIESYLWLQGSLSVETK